MKAMTLHAHAGPNPWKVAIILEELSLPYETKIWRTEDQKTSAFRTKLNPNGFTPVLEDPNTNVTLWESGAIIQYILDTYDKGNLITFPSTDLQEHFDLLKYLYFQNTFQGPNISAARYFTMVQPNPQARRRFVDESIRVVDVLEGALEGKAWLVGGKCSAADLVFVPFMQSLKVNLGDEAPDLAREFPRVHSWMQNMGTRASVKKVTADRTSVLEAARQVQGLQK